jgi:CRP/FNR family transcriptional regulator
MSNNLYNINKYQQKSYIILEGEKKSQSFHIIKEGKVSISKLNPVFGEKKSEVIGPGDFFGVVGAMSQLPQPESAFAMTTVVTISINYKKLPEMVQSNPALAIKIIRSFSKKLRQFSERNMVSHDREVDEEENFDILYNLALSYLNLGKKRMAAYIFKCYLHYLPNGENSDKAKENLVELDSKNPFIKKSGTIQTYNDGEIIFCQNEPSNEVYVLKSGRVRISKIVDNKEIQLFIMMPGDIFGEMSLIENKTRSATAIALEDSDLLAIKKENFETMSQKEPQLMARIISLLSERIWNANKLILNSYLNDLDYKILDMLLILYERSKVINNGLESFDFKVQFNDVINMIGLEEKIDKLEDNFLKKYKFIKIERNSLICTNINNLERLILSKRARIDTLE